MERKPCKKRSLRDSQRGVEQKQPTVSQPFTEHEDARCLKIRDRPFCLRITTFQKSGSNRVRLAIFLRWAKPPLTLRRLESSSWGNAQYSVARTLRQGQAIGKQKMTKWRQNDQLCGNSVLPSATECLPTVIQIPHKDPIKIRKRYSPVQLAIEANSSSISLNK